MCRVVVYGKCNNRMAQTVREPLLILLKRVLKMSIGIFIALNLIPINGLEGVETNGRRTRDWHVWI